MNKELNYLIGILMGLYAGYEIFSCENKCLDVDYKYTSKKHEIILEK